MGFAAEVMELNSRAPVGLVHSASRKKVDEATPVERWAKCIIGESPELKKVFDLIKVLGPRPTSVLITGETGTGKELVARALHENGPRAPKPFVALNCGAIPEHLLEDELFGHVQGAFTGAQKNRVGKFEQAHGGTLFLDEIGDMPLSLQCKLLRVLESRQIERLGSNVAVQLDVRLIAATNCRLREKIKEGSFREDLYYRLAVVPIRLPALRERISDLPLLIQHFMRLFNEPGMPQKVISDETLEKLTQWSWAGNIRELRNAVEYAMLVSGSRQTLVPADFPGTGSCAASPGDPLRPANCSLPDEGLDLSATLSQLEKIFLQQALEQSGGNKCQAARLLSLNRSTLNAKLRRYEMVG